MPDAAIERPTKKLAERKQGGRKRHSQSLKLEPTLRRALEQLAASQGYPLETMITLLLREALSRRLRGGGHAN